MNQSEFKANACNRRQARENSCYQITIGFGFTSYWLKRWREFHQPITERGNAKPKQKRNYFRHSIENRSKFRNFALIAFGRSAKSCIYAAREIEAYILFITKGE